MKATFCSEYFMWHCTFRVTHEGLVYDVVVWLDEKGKFIDDLVSLNGEVLGFEGSEGEVQEAILDFLEENWEKFFSGKSSASKDS